LEATVAEIRLEERGIDDLVGHANIPIAFLVDRILAPTPDGGPLAFRVQPHPQPWWKDYDAEAGAEPALWTTRFDTSTWRVISAWHRSERVGGVVLVHDVPGVDMLEGREDLALIWDLRVTPSFRRQGVGASLIGAAVEWARSRGCPELKVETQNINVDACQFYERHGFELRSINPNAYPDLPDEVQMLW
jgi:GNAT superfamily N-acetyltransferase